MLLSLILFLPIVGAVLLMFLPRQEQPVELPAGEAAGHEPGGHDHGDTPPTPRATTIKWAAFFVSLVTFLLSLWMWAEFDSNADGRFQFVESVPWVPQLGITYHLGVDGLSMVLIVLTTFLSAIAILASWTAINERVKEYMIFLLLLETGMLGVFMARDLFLFYVFWEVMLLPMYFLIGIWGGPRRVYATIKFVLYTLVGSLLMLVAILYLYLATSQVTGGAATFDLQTAFQVAPTLSREAQIWLFLAFGLAFAIKVPMFPFHTWLPDAHTEAPTAGSVILAGVLLKMGTYGFLRFCMMLFPAVATEFAPYMILLGVVGIVYGALVSLVQTDVKRLVAYSSVSHLGFVLLGMFAFNQQGLQGAVLQMINHGLSTGGLFLLVGMIYERRHTREIGDFGGLWKVIPVFTAFFLIVMLSSIGLPGLNGFVGEFLILLGAFEVPANRVLTAVGALGVILGAAYMLWMFQRVMQGPLDKPENQRLLDLTRREVAVLVPIVVMMFVIGIYPNLFLKQFDQSVRDIVTHVAAAGQGITTEARSQEKEWNRDGQDRQGRPIIRTALGHKPLTARIHSPARPQ
jgi:NADH-quinone oxidoreductase subunit M